MKKWMIIAMSMVMGMSASAAEIGFKSGVFQSYNGGVELFTSQKAPLEAADTPVSLFVKHENFRISYSQYSQHASDKYASGSTTGGASILIHNTVLSCEYLADLGERGSGIYGGAGVGLFKSAYVLDAYLSSGSTITSLGGTIKSGSDFDIGFLLIGGARKKIGNGFVGAELNYINKDIQHKKNAAGSSDPDKIDIGGVMFMLTTGVAF